MGIRSLELSFFGDLLPLMVPEQPRAPVLQPHFEDEVLGSFPGGTPLSAERARQSPQLGGKPRALAHPHLLADPYCLRAHVGSSSGGKHRRSRRPYSSFAGCTGCPACSLTRSNSILACQ